MHPKYVSKVAVRIPEIWKTKFAYNLVSFEEAFLKSEDMVCAPVFLTSFSRKKSEKAKPTYCTSFMVPYHVLSRCQKEVDTRNKYERGDAVINGRKKFTISDILRGRLLAVLKTLPDPPEGYQPDPLRKRYIVRKYAKASDVPEFFSNGRKRTRKPFAPVTKDKYEDTIKTPGLH